MSWEMRETFLITIHCGIIYLLTTARYATRGLAFADCTVNGAVMPFEWQADQIQHNITA
jgi:hypothetical protein